MRYEAATIHKFTSDDGITLVEVTLKKGKLVNCMVFLDRTGKVDMPISEFVELAATLNGAASFLAELGFQDGDWQPPGPDSRQKPNMVIMPEEVHEPETADSVAN